VLRTFGYLNIWQEAEDCIMRSFIHGLYASSNIVKMIKSMSMRWVGHVARMGDMRNV
jgi:hypothetical protein